MTLAPAEPRAFGEKTGAKPEERLDCYRPKQLPQSVLHSTR